MAVASGDASAFRGVSGVGAKTASRIVLELTGKLDISPASAPAAQGDGEVVRALTALGYATSEALAALASLPDGASVSVEERVRLCLQQMGGR
jgi:Holliday junction DNA helicase RuvA